MQVGTLGRGLLAIALVGCASSSASTESGTTPTAGAGTVASIQVQNNSPGASESSVFIVPEVGQRVPLGSVQSMSTSNFSYDAQPGYYTIEVQPTGASTRRSDRFRLTNTDRATWNMSAGSRVTVGAK